MEWESDLEIIFLFLSDEESEAQLTDFILSILKKKRKTTYVQFASKVVKTVRLFVFRMYAELLSGEAETKRDAAGEDTVVSTIALQKPLRL